MAMHDPPHPGGIVRRQCLEALDLSVTEAAKGLGVTQMAYDLWQARERVRSIRVRHFKAA